MLIKVTEQHIASGKKARAEHKIPNTFCPLAQAIQEQTGNPNWRVGQCNCWIHCRDAPATYLRHTALPDIAVIAVRKYDGTGEMEPFEVELPINNKEPPIVNQSNS